MDVSVGEDLSEERLAGDEVEGVGLWVEMVALYAEEVGREWANGGVKGHVRTEVGGSSGIGGSGERGVGDRAGRGETPFRLDHLLGD